jgi:hypothetical protein
MLPLLALGQQQAANAAASNPFQVLPANPSLVQQIEAIHLQLDQAVNKHDADAVVALFTANATLVTPGARLSVVAPSGNITATFFNVLTRPGEFYTGSNPVRVTNRQQISYGKGLEGNFESFSFGKLEHVLK